eukprot:2496014-Amphidinium_carterae.3
MSGPELSCLAATLAHQRPQMQFAAINVTQSLGLGVSSNTQLRETISAEYAFLEALFPLQGYPFVFPVSISDDFLACALVPCSSSLATLPRIATESS